MDATVAFNPNTSFLTVIMALLGGATSVWGPMLGVIPLVLISDYLSVTVPNYFSVVLGVVLLGHRLLRPGRPDRPAAARRLFGPPGSGSPASCAGSPNASMPAAPAAAGPSRPCRRLGWPSVG